MSGQALLVMVAVAKRRDDIVDALMTVESISGFSVVEAAGFSRAHSQLSLRESVQGYGDYDRFEVLCDAATRELLFERLTDVVGRDHLRYWIVPVLEEGTIGHAPIP